MPDPAPVPFVRQPVRQEPRNPPAPQQLAPRQSPRIPRDPVPAAPILIDLLKLRRRIHYLHPRRDGWQVLAIPCNALNLKHLPPHVASPPGHS